MEVIGGRKASTLETLCACGRPEDTGGGGGTDVDGSGVGDARLGIDRVFLSLRTGGDRLPSWLEDGDLGGACAWPFLNMAGGRNELMLMRERRLPWG